MSTITINWHYVGWAIFFLMSLFSFAIAVFFVILYFTKGTGGVKSAVQVIEKDAKTVLSTSTGQDIEALAVKAAKAAVAEFQSSKPITVPNHPAVTAAIELVQKVAEKEAALQKVVSAVNDVQTTAQATVGKAA